jgi:hypothetical protein
MRIPMMFSEPLSFCSRLGLDTSQASIFQLPLGAFADEFQLVRLHISVSASCLLYMPTGPAAFDLEGTPDLRSSGVDVFLCLVEA